MRRKEAGSGTWDVGWKEATVVTPPSTNDAVPVVKLVASVLMARMKEVCPGWILAESGGLKLNPITFPTPELRSPVTGATVPLTKGPKTSVRKPRAVEKPVKVVSVSRLIGSQLGLPAVPQFAAV